MTATQKASLRTGAYIAFTIASVIVAVATTAADLRSKVASMEAWKDSHICDTQRAAEFASKRDTTLAVIDSQLKTVIKDIEAFKAIVKEDFAEIKASLRDLHANSVAAKPSQLRGDMPWGVYKPLSSP